jgi:hypothetical protein
MRYWIAVVVVRATIVVSQREGGRTAGPRISDAAIFSPMPKRSDIYQRLVYEIHRELGPGWKVTESAMVKDVVTGKEREVDILLESEESGYPIAIAVEVRDRSRVQSVAWVEEMVTRHRDLRISKSVLWSPTPLSKAAVKKAEANGFVVVTPQDGSNAPWAKLARDLRGGSVRLVTPTLTPTVDVRLPDGTGVRWDATAATQLRIKGTDVAWNVGAILQRMAGAPEAGKQFLDHAENGRPMYGIFEPPSPCEMTGPNGEVGEVIRLLVAVDLATDQQPLVTRSVLHKGAVTTLAEAQVLGGELSTVVRELPDGTVSIRSSHEPTPPAAAKKAKTPKKGKAKTPKKGKAKKRRK